MGWNKDRVNLIIREAIREDLGRKDVTTQSLIPKGAKIKAKILVKEKGLVAGLGVARMVFKMLDERVKFKSFFKDGQRLEANTIVAELNGPARAILIAERTALNFLGRLSGIATYTKEFVDRVEPYKVKIMDTRKTTPALRYLEKYAVRLGGGYNHRMGLYDQVLIKDNHIRTQMSKREKKGLILARMIRQLRKRISRRIKIEVEVESLDELKEALDSKPDIVMLDNMRLEEIKEAIRIRNRLEPRTKLEASGRINLINVREIAKTGIDMVSVGSLTHSAKFLDVSLEVV